jgi:hypothetical protein
VRNGADKIIQLESSLTDERNAEVRSKWKQRAWEINNGVERGVTRRQRKYERSEATKRKMRIREVWDLRGRLRQNKENLSQNKKG